MRVSRIAGFVVIAVAVAGCRQYAASTRSEILESDNAANYQRVFGEAAPSNVTVVNSIVVKYEFRPFVVTTDDWEFEILAPRAWVDQEIETLGLDPADQRGVAAITERKDDPIRPWYAPKPIDAYELYYLRVTSIPYVHMLVQRQQESDGRSRVFVSKH